MDNILIADGLNPPHQATRKDIASLEPDVCKINFVLFSHQPKAEFILLRSGKFTAEFKDMAAFETYVNNSLPMMGAPIKVWEGTQIVREGYAGTF